MPNNSANVALFDATLLWPVRIQAQGDLYQKRTDDRCRPCDWLEAYADWLASTGTSRWRRVHNPYREKFGAPRIYPEDRLLYQEFVYFHPFIQELLYEPRRDRHAMVLLVRDDVRHLAIELRSRQRLRFQVECVQFYLFTTDVGILAVHLTHRDETSLHTAMDALNEMRRVYPPYWKSGGPAGDAPISAQWLDAAEQPLGVAGQYDSAAPYCREVAECRRPPAAAHWRSLMDPVRPWDAPPPGSRREFMEGGLFYRQIADERMPVQALLAADRSSTISDAEYMRLTFVDAGASDWASAKEFLMVQKGDHWYDRFWHNGTRFLVTGYSFIAVTGDAGFARDHLRNHMRHHYFKLFLLAQMQKASLLVAWERLSELMRDYAAESASDASREEFHRRHRWLAADLANYLAVFEFSEVTNQLQGRELFEMIRRNLGSRELYDEISKQIQFALDEERTHFNERITTNQQSLNWSLGALSIAVAALSVVSSLAKSTEQKMLVSGIAMAIVLTLVLHRWRPWRSERTARIWVVPANDLESVRIGEMLESAGEQMRVTRQAPGATWADLEPGIKDDLELFRRCHADGLIYGVELAGPDLYGGIDIDHHRDAVEDRRSTYSSIEQVGLILGKRLTRAQRLAASNDRAWIPGLKAAGAEAAEIDQIRRADREAQGITREQEAQARREIGAAVREPSGTWIVECAGRPSSAQRDFLFERTGAAEPCLCKAPAWWSYSGPAAERLAELGLPEKQCADGDAGFGYFEVEQPSLESQGRMLEALGLDRARSAGL